jgi:hypothetical protein
VIRWLRGAGSSLWLNRVDFYVALLLTPIAVIKLHSSVPYLVFISQWAWVRSSSTNVQEAKLRVDKEEGEEEA